MTFRRIIFWVHLAAGLVAGAVIAVMSFTGVMLAFEKEIIAWAERDARRVTPPSPGAPCLPLEELLASVREVQPDARPFGLTLQNDPRAAVLFSLGRTNAFYVNPYNGEVQPQGAKATRAFMQVMIGWHRYLGGHDERRAVGKAVTGACNAAFLFLAASGLYLWWPRQWTRPALRAVAVFNFKLSGKARDWNWHNVIGLWSAPVLIVLTATAMPISYRWAGDLIYALTRSDPPPAGAGPAAAPLVEVPPPPAGTKALGWDALVAAAQREFPQWNQITLRLGGGPRGGAAGTGAQPVSIAIKQRSGAPRFATAQLTLDPFTGAVLRQEKFSDYNLGRKVRSWTRFLHTGEALGPAGQAVAGIASLGGLFLVWTGFALAWRRLFGRKPAVPAAETPPAVAQDADKIWQTTEGASTADKVNETR